MEERAVVLFHLLLKVCWQSVLECFYYKRVFTLLGFLCAHWFSECLVDWQLFFRDVLENNICLVVLFE